MWSVVDRSAARPQLRVDDFLRRRSSTSGAGRCASTGSLTMRAVNGSAARSRCSDRAGCIGSGGGEHGVFAEPSLQRRAFGDLAEGRRVQQRTAAAPARGTEIKEAPYAEADKSSSTRSEQGGGRGGPAVPGLAGSPPQSSPCHPALTLHEPSVRWSGDPAGRVRLRFPLFTRYVGVTTLEPRPKIRADDPRGGRRRSRQHASGTQWSDYVVCSRTARSRCA